MAAVTPNTFTMAVPWDGAGRGGSPAMQSATRRPWRLATLARAMSEVPPPTQSSFSTASPTA